MVDQRMGAVLREVVGVAVHQPARVEAEKAVMGEEQRTAIVRAKRQADAVEALAVLEGGRGFPADLIGRHVDRMGGRGEGQHEGDQRLVVAGDRQRVGPVAARGPVPHQPVGGGAKGGPVHPPPQTVDFRGQRAGAKPLPRGQQTHHQERGFDDVAAVVIGRKGDRGAGAAVHPMREGALITWLFGKEIDDLRDPVDHPLAG